MEQLAIPDFENLPLPEKQQKALEAISEFASLARRTVEQAWLAGKWLTAVKTELGHGSWLPWLNENGIEPRTAQRFMKLAAVEMRRIVAFDSMDAALKALKPDPLAGWKQKAEKHCSASEENLRKGALEYWHLGECLTKQVEIKGEREIDAFIKENNIDRSLVVVSRDLYERHSLEGLAALPSEDLESLLVS